LAFGLILPVRMIAFVLSGRKRRFFMAVDKMKLVNIVGRLKEFDMVVRECCIKGNFHPEPATSALEGYEEFVPVDEPNPFALHLRMAVDTAVHSGIALSYSDFSGLSIPDGELPAYVEKIQHEVNDLSAAERACITRCARLQQSIEQLEHLSELDVDLDEIFSCRFVNYRFGRLPKESYAKLEVHEEAELLIFFPIGEDTRYYWGFYVTLKDNAEKVDEIFASLYFERVDILTEAHGTPAVAVKNIKTLLAAAQQELAAAHQKLKDYWTLNLDVFLRVYSKYRYLSDSFELRKYAAKCGDSFYVFGWVPQEDVESFEKQFKKLKYVDCIIEDEENAENIVPPTKLNNSKAIKPFEGFVEMYGLPSYNEIDPTPVLSITYAVMFGIMFGDLGQGFIILLVALWMKFKKKMFLGDVMIRCSFFSMLFGTLYNSVFGYETLLPFTVLPVHNDNYVNSILMISIFYGVFLILFCMVLNIINGIKQKNLEKVFFSHNGVTGIIFYISGVTAVVMFMLFKTNILSPLFLIFLIVLPLVVIALREPLTRLIEHKKDWMPAKKGEFFMESFFELFEVILSFMSNTISYIRVGAFILSHAGMMAAVFVLSELAGHGQNPFVVVFGNVFVIGLEGLIVGIQVLRLEFYEMFSRFYEGTGKPYEPVSIKYNQ
jgi:V/A-type H+-transporting ATPase subunit I